MKLIKRFAVTLIFSLALLLVLNIFLLLITFRPDAGTKGTAGGWKGAAKLAEYLTKDEYTREKKQDGTIGKPRIKESSYSHSRNMQIVPPKKEKLRRWKREVEPKKGYYIARIWEGINSATGYKCRRYTMIRLNRSVKEDESYDIHRDYAGRSRHKKRRVRRGCRVHHKKRRKGDKGDLRDGEGNNVVS